MSKKQYGLPYCGSKNTIANEIIEFLPQKEILVDLFGGGGAITQCAAESGKYKQVIYNDFNTLIHNTFIKALNGEFKDEKRWIGRDDFFKLKDSDGYVVLCFSFGNDMSTYLYSKEIEPLKKAIHYAVVLNDFSLLKQYIPNEIEQVEKKLDLIDLSDTKQRRLTLRKYDRLQNLERLNRINDINGEYTNITFYNKSYEQLELPSPKDCVIYCDIPYDTKATKTMKSYNNNFNHDAFYKWCIEKAKQGYDVYVSSYEMPADIFDVVWSKSKNQTCSAKGGTIVTEKIFKVKPEIIPDSV